MLNISEPNIIEQDETGGPVGSDDGPRVRITRNQTDPYVIEDGIDVVEISSEADNRFRVEYHGYVAGRVWLTRDGVRELKRNFLDNREEIPGWTLSTELSELPGWFPTPGNLPTPVACDECGSEVSVTEVVTRSEYRYCPDCW